MSRRSLVLVATILGSSMAFVDATVITVALPVIGRDLGLGLAGRQWVYLAYSLALAAFYLLAGAIGDRVGHRRTFLAGTAGFAAASAFAGAAPTGALLLVARALQGLAAAFLTTSSLALLRATFRDESGRAIGIWTAWTGIATVGGPTLGGALAEYATWRLIFFLNLPLAVGAFALTARCAEDEARAEGPRRPFDALGAGLFAAGFGLLVYGLVELESRGVAAVWWAPAGGCAALAAALVHEARTDDPVLPLALFRERLFAAANGETFLVYAALSGSTFFLVLYLQTVVGYSPVESSLTMVPVSIALLLLSGLFGRLADERGPRLFLAVGPALLAGGMLLWWLVVDGGDWWALALGVCLFSLGLAITVAPITAAALGAVPERLAGLAAGFNNTVSRVGGLVAVSLVGLTISFAYTEQGTPLTSRPQSRAEHAAAVAAFRAGMGVAAGLAAAGALVGALAVPARARVG